MPGDVLTTSVSRVRNSHPFSNLSAEATENQYWSLSMKLCFLKPFKKFFYLFCYLKIIWKDKSRSLAALEWKPSQISYLHCSVMSTRAQGDCIPQTLRLHQFLKELRASQTLSCSQFLFFFALPGTIGAYWWSPVSTGGDRLLWKSFLLQPSDPNTSISSFHFTRLMPTL